MVICLQRGADLHIAHLMPLTVSCFSKIKICFIPFWYRLTRVVPRIFHGPAFSASPRLQRPAVECDTNYSPPVHRSLLMMPIATSAVCCRQRDFLE